MAFRLLSSSLRAAAMDGAADGGIMALAKRLIAALLLTAAAAFLLASSTMAGERVGVVTNVEGTATVARLAQPDGQPL